MSKYNEFFIEPGENGYRVLRPNAVRASAVTDTQKEAIERAKELDRRAVIHVARVRNVGPGPDKWRKP